MHSIDSTALPPRDVARLLMSIVVPRPIGWASTVNAAGLLNLAPFSFFNAVGSNPPMVMLSISRRQGEAKDTLRNIQETGEFVVNIADESLAEALMLTSGEYSGDVDEFEVAGLATAPSAVIRPPRVALAPAALEVKLTQVVPVSETGYTMVIGRVLYFHVREGLLRANGMVDAELLRPLARLAGDEFATIGRVFEMARPTVQEAI
jgi:flavin reductase (DIM6/NTAB) family NADH-FMN oxidoreductase RutF